MLFKDYPGSYIADYVAQESEASVGSQMSLLISLIRNIYYIGAMC
jgi:hypothetical protein